MIRALPSTAGLLALTLGFGCLAGCASDNGTRHFGTNRTNPNQNQLSAAPPLSLPPMLTQRPSRTPGQAPDDAPGAPPLTGGPLSDGQQSLLAASGPAAPANIRQRIAQDTQLRKHDDAFTETLLFGTPSGVPSGSSADGSIIQHGGKSWFSSIF